MDPGLSLCFDKKKPAGVDWKTEIAEVSVKQKETNSRGWREWKL